jgi:ACR3 family arsenite efflux pump ArsB
MFVSIFSSPVGLIAALSYSDAKRQYKTQAIVIRSTVSLVVFIVIFALIAFLSETEVSPFLKNQGWIVIVLAAPLLAALTTEKIMLRQKALKATHNPYKASRCQ